MSDLQMRAYYAARAREYDQVYENPERQADLRLLREALPRHFIGSRVLDVAAGTGFWTADIADVAHEVVLVDGSHEPLDIARRRLPADKARFVIGDAYSIPTAAAIFDAGFVGFWFSHIPKTRRAEFIRGLSARMRSGGIIVLVDDRYVEGSSRPVADSDAGGNTYQIRYLSDGSEHRVLKNFPSREELENVAAEFAVATTYWELDHYWVFTYVVR